MHIASLRDNLHDMSKPIVSNEKKNIMNITCDKIAQRVVKVITKTCLYNADPLKPHFYIGKLGFTGVYIIFLISAQKHRLWLLGEAVLTSIHNLCFERKYEKYQSFFI